MLWYFLAFLAGVVLGAFIMVVLYVVMLIKGGPWVG